MLRQGRSKPGLASISPQGRDGPSLVCEVSQRAELPRVLPMLESSSRGPPALRVVFKEEVAVYQDWAYHPHHAVGGL